jgi:hypothetical protein
VLPHLARQSATLTGIGVRKGVYEILLNDLGPQANNVAGDPGQSAANGPTGLDADRLDKRDADANGGVFGKVPQASERHSMSQKCGESFRNFAYIDKLAADGQGQFGFDTFGIGR